MRSKDLGIDQLSITERIRLVEEIWDGIAAEAEHLAVPESHKRKLDQRLNNFTSSTPTASWADVKTRIQKSK